jgi:hypothetical protein
MVGQQSTWRCWRIPPNIPPRCTGADSGGTASPLNVESSEENKALAARDFMRRWNFDFFWSTLIGHEAFGPFGTDMGHAEYAAGGVDRRDTITCPFNDPEEVLAFDFWEKLGEIDQALSGGKPRK